MDLCKVCPLPKEAKCCECSLKSKVEIKIEITVITKKSITIVKGNFLSTEKWRRKALKELKRKFSCNGSIRHGELILSGSHSSLKIKEILLNVLQ
ncbi:MAG: hypothetical protein QW140_02145 [Candidatus Aenigmatarchaeota archaeon]